jgi:hypothetical protein
MSNIAVVIVGLFLLSGCTREYTEQLWSGQWDARTDSQRHMCDMNPLGYGCPYKSE